ncbi:hypothetical protein P170DRAFT_472231 [Aspergillus steynii IBT 23096]|uniref:Uncharacterized protein n=1 Tax=Aspergillus steynii IBT 23096 TaxID=1392250 RepID=A0A2I2GHH7_9EURO|nr:uncharacterized protein P170DRAFT_472231 [Aspergillus steynii IBT 23096]PLB52328.1 hypothetical protein P170DRAFT_472231 [Aspergillus steynii IBT 23096]
MSQVDISWTRSVIAGISNLILYTFLVRVVPLNCCPLIPVIQISFEPIFHYLAGAEKTPSYNIVVAPLLHATNCFEWGLKQVVKAPRLTVAPITYLGSILISRLILDLHLVTILRHRKDLQWARQNVLTPTISLVGYLAAMLFVERLGLPVATYIKPLTVMFMDIVGFFPHIIPASYAIVFDQVKVIKS